MNSLLQQMLACLCMQVRVIGARYGKWGLDNYGKTPKKVDALEFYPARLRALLPQIKEAQAQAGEQALPSAFVTFKDRHTQVVAGDIGRRSNA